MHETIRLEICAIEELAENQRPYFSLDCPSWKIPFSDALVLLSHIWRTCKSSSLHRPVDQFLNFRI
jgi:hypothetical protein